MEDKLIIGIIEKTLNKKMIEDSQYIKYSYYELKIKENLSDEEIYRFLQLIKIKLEQLDYTVMFTGAKYEYQECNRMIQSNELMVAIKDYKNYK